ncbi:MAG: alpha-mannosidase [Promethearchaeota archaeon]
MAKIGKYSGNERLDPKEMEEPDLDNEFTRKMWFEDIKDDEDFLEDIKEHVNELKKNVSITTDPEKLEIHMVGQSHIDVAWKWRYEQTRQKAIKTFRKACIHSELFPDKFRFALSEPLLLEWVKEDDPALFEDIKKYVATGNIELVGGSYVEPDCMMPSGEAFVRQRLYGQRFYRDHFNKLAEVEWFLDSFGYNYGLPQILVKSGAKAFWTSKITWNRQTIFPFVNFWWQSPDGTKILTSNFSMGLGPIMRWVMYEMGRHPLKKDGRKVWDYTYNYEEIDEHVEEDEICPHVGDFFGKGDGGHGPTHQEVAEANGFDAIGFAKWSSVGTFFDKLREWSDRFPIWNDELYLEYHRGTFSVHAEVKRHNRLYENQLTATETLALMTSLIDSNYKYPYETLEDRWKTLLKNQFHDVLPGSSIPEVYDDVYDDWQDTDRALEDIRNEISEKLSAKLVADNDKTDSQLSESIMGKTKYLGTIGLYNSLSWERKSPVFISVDNFSGNENKDLITLSPEGRPPEAVILIKDENDGTLKIYPAQPTPAETYTEAYPRHAGWWSVIDLKPLSVTTAQIRLINEGASLQDLINVPMELTINKSDDFTIFDNKKTVLKIDNKTGAFIELKSGNINDGKNLLKGNNSNLFYGFLDDYRQDHAWNIKPEYWKYPLDDIKNDESVKVEVVEQGPVFTTLEISKILGKDKSPVRQRITLFKDLEEVYMDWSTNWKQPFVMLKVLYATDTKAEFSTADETYCAIQRKTQPDTPCDSARYEKIMHKYCDLSTPDKKWGIAFINEGKYAYDTMGGPGDFRLTLLRTPRYPTPAGEAWVNKERNYNKEKYGHEVPEFSGLGHERCRYMIYPHNHGALTDKNNKPMASVKRRAEEFNQPVIIIPFNSSNSSDNKIPLNIMQPLLELTPSNIFMGALKLNEWEKSGSIILRIVEGSGVDTKNVKIKFGDILADKIKEINCVDLLERKIEGEFEWKKDTAELTFSIGRFEVKTFELKI